MVTVATGPQPTQPNPLSPIASVGGLLLGRNVVQQEMQERAQAQAEREAQNNAMLAALMGGQQQGPGVSQAQGNPFAAMPEISLRGGQQTQGQPGGEFTASAQPQPMQTQQPASPQDPGGEFTAQASQAPPAPSPRSSGVGSGPQAQQADPEVEALGQMPGQVGQIFRNMGIEQRTRAVQALRESGSSVSEIMEMVQPEQTEYGFMETDQGVVATNPGTGEARVALEGQQQRDPNTDLAKLRSDYQAGLVTREEFQRQRDQILTGEQQDPWSTDELRSHMAQQVRAGEMTEEEFQEVDRLLQGPQGSELSAKARTISALERRKRGEETGSSVDAFSPERAGEIQDAMINQPGRYQAVTGPNGRLFWQDTQQDPQSEDAMIPATNLPPLVDPRDEVEGSTTSGRTFTGRGELGIAGRLQQFGNVLSPQFGGQLPNPQRTELENSLNNMREDLVSVLRDNRRLLSTQVAEIRNLLPDPNAWFENTPNAMAKMLTLRGRLLRDRKNAMALANDPQKTPSSKGEAQEAADALDPIIDQLTVPASTFNEATPEQSFEFAQALTPTSAQALDRETVDAMVGKMSEEQLSNLNTNVLMALQGGSDGNAR